MLAYIKALYNAKDLLSSWTSRNIRARYQQSALGWLWAVIQPVAQVFIFTTVFRRIVPVDTGDIPYPVFSYVALVPWALLSSSIPDMTGTLVGNMNLVTKIYFPREVLPISSLLARLMDFGVAIALLVLLMVVYKIEFFPLQLLYFPVILAVQLLLLLGLGLACAAANVFFRDVQSLLSLGIQIWFYASPIIYPVSMVPESLRRFYYFNPMTGILESYRDIVVYGQPPGWYLIVAFGVSLVIFISGYWFFKRVEFQFADIV